MNRQRVFSIGQVIAGSIIASPIAAIGMMIWNDFLLGNRAKAWRTLGISALVLIAYLVATIDFLHHVPAAFHIVFSSIVVAVIAYYSQRTAERMIEDGRVSRMNAWRFILFCFVCVLVVGGAGAFLVIATSA